NEKESPVDTSDSFFSFLFFLRFDYLVLSNLILYLRVDNFVLSNRILYLRVDILFLSNRILCLQVDILFYRTVFRICGSIFYFYRTVFCVCGSIIEYIEYVHIIMHKKKNPSVLLSRILSYFISFIVIPNYMDLLIVTSLDLFHLH